MLRLSITEMGRGRGGGVKSKEPNQTEVHSVQVASGSEINSTYFWKTVMFLKVDLFIFNIYKSKMGLYLVSKRKKNCRFSQKVNATFCYCRRFDFWGGSCAENWIHMCCIIS